MIEDFGLNQSDILKINGVFEQLPKIQTVIIYGSRAKGNFRPGSDIDITLTGDNLTLTDVNELSTILDDLLLPYLFDISIFDKIENPEFTDHINRVGKVFYTKQK